MSENQKAQEIALAIIKISVYVRRHELRRRLESMAFALLEESGKGNLTGLSAIISALEAIIRFGSTIYEIEPMNADIILRQLGNLNSAIQLTSGLSLPNYNKSANIEEIFSKSQTLFPDVLPNGKIRQNSIGDKSGNKLERIIVDNSAINQIDSLNNPDKSQDSAKIMANSSDSVQKKPRKKRKISIEPRETEDNAAMRQSAIIEKIRQFGNKEAKLKDIIAEFPDFSERTLRYDIQRLCSQGILERIGAGGPGTFYRLREI